MPTMSDMTYKGNNKTAAFTGDMTNDKTGTDIMPTNGKPPLDMPINNAAKLASTRYESISMRTLSEITWQ
jgi:hypothetical protein